MLRIYIIFFVYVKYLLCFLTDTKPMTRRLTLVMLFVRYTIF